MKKMVIIYLAFLLIGIIFATACTSSTQYSPSSVPVPVSSGSNLKILEHHLTREGSSSFPMVTVVGTAQNIGSSRISYGSVEVKFYDSSGALLSNGLDNFNNLDPGEKWNFKAMYMGTDGEKVASYKIGVGSTF